MTQKIDRAALYARALATYGKESQVLKVQEELAELGVAFTHWLRDPSTENLIALHGELADVRIVLEQVAMWVDYDLHECKALGFAPNPIGIMRNFANVTSNLHGFVVGASFARQSLKNILLDANAAIDWIIAQTNSASIVATLEESKLARLAERLDAMKATQQARMVDDDGRVR